jgi:hypothetical protein
MKRLIAVLIACAAAFAAACGGGGGSTPPPPPPNNGFSNSSLSGQYAFEMSGTDLNGGFIARVGSFTANGSGTITAAVEDVNDATSGGGTVTFSGGSYSIGTDGRGTITLNGGSLGGGLGLNVALTSTSNGYAVQTDGNATSSGSFDLQTASSFALSSITGPYAFDLAGIDSSSAPLSIVGQFSASGGPLTGGLIDINDGSQSAPSGPNPITAATFTLDPTLGTTSGRGTVSINNQGMVFYIVNGGRLKFLEEDSVAITVGDAFSQTGTIPTAVSGLSGNFSFIVSGAALLGNFGSIDRVGSGGFNAGALASVTLDDNNAGTYTALNGDSGSYTIDSAGSGRGTFTFTDSKAGTFSYVFYLFSPTQALLSETSTGVIGSGSMSAQPSSISSSLGTNFAFNWSGVTIPSSGNIGFEEDFVGQYTLSSSSTSGTVDFTELGSTSTPVFLGVPLSGTLTINGSGSGRNALKVTLSPSGGAPSTTINFAAYVGSGNTLYLVTTDSTRVTAGSVSPQTTP